MSKKGFNLASLQSAAVMMGLIIITVSIMATVLGTLAGTQTASSVERNVTEAGLESMAIFSDWFSILVIVVVAAVVIGVLLIYLGRTRE